MKTILTALTIAFAVMAIGSGVVSAADLVLLEGCGYGH